MSFILEIIRKRFIPTLFEDDNILLDSSIVPHFHIAKKYQKHISLVNISFFGWKLEDYFPDSSVSSKAYEEKWNMRSAMEKHNLFDTNPNNFLSLIIFSVLFSGEYDEEIKKNTRLFNAKNDFYILLNNMNALPPIDEDAIGKIRDRIDKQTTYKEMFTSDNSLLPQYDNLGDVHKQVSLFATVSKQIEGDPRFDKLYISAKITSFKEYKEKDSPFIILGHVENYLKSNAEIKTLLKAYEDVKKFDDNEDYANNYFDMVNIILGLIKTISYTDEEKNITSIFNDDFKYILDFILNTNKKVKDLNSISWLTIQSNNFYFLETNASMLNMSAGHCLLEEGHNNKDGKFKSRNKNVLSFLNTVLEHKDSKYKIDFTKGPSAAAKEDMKKNRRITPDSFDIEDIVKSNTISLNEGLNYLNGVTKRLADIDGALQTINSLKKEIAAKNKLIDNHNMQIKNLKTGKGTITDKFENQKRNSINSQMNSEELLKHTDKINKKIANHTAPFEARILKIEGDISKLESEKAQVSGKLNKLGIDDRIYEKKISDYLNTKTYKRTLTSTKTLSNALAIWGIIAFAKSAEKLNTKNLLTLLSDLATITSSVLENSLKVLNRKPALVGISTKLARYGVNLGVFAAGINIILSIYNTVDNYSKLDELDTDAQYINNIGGGIQVVLLIMILSGGSAVVLLSAVALVYAITEIILYLVTNTQVENYILKSVLAINDDQHKAIILREVLDNEGTKVFPFNNAKAVQKYLGDNHDKLKPIFHSAFEQEHSELVKSLHGYELKLYGDILEEKEKETFKRKTGVQIPKELFEDKSFKMIIVDETGGYELITERTATPHETFYVYDLLFPRFSDTEINDLDNKNYSIIVITNNISMKYNYSYGAFRYKYPEGKKNPLISKKINNFKEELLNQKDESYIKGLK